MRNISILTLFVLFLSCSSGKDNIPHDIIPKDKMMTILMDIHIAEAGVKIETSPDSTLAKANDYYHFIFRQNEVSEEDFRKSFRYYAKHPELLQSIYQTMLDEMSKKESEVLNNKN